MIRQIIICLILFFGLTSYSQEQVNSFENSSITTKDAIAIGLNFTSVLLSDDKSEAMKNLAEDTAEGFARSMVISSMDGFIKNNLSQLDNLAGVAGENAMTGTVSQVFAGIQLYRAGDELLDADTGSGKYYAAVRAVGAAVSFIHPAIGGLIALHSVVTELLGNLVVKNDIEKIQKLYTEQTKYSMQYKANIEALILSDFENISQLFNYYSTEIARYQGYMSKISKMNACGTSLSPDLLVLMTCFDLSMKAYYSLKSSVLIMNSIFETENSLVDINKIIVTLLNESKANITLSSLKNELKQLEDQLIVVEEQIPFLVSDIIKAKIDLLITDIKIKNENLFFPTLKCVTFLTNKILEINKVKVSLLISANDPISEQSALLQNGEDLITLSKSNVKVCLSSSDSDNEFYPVLKQLDQQIEDLEVSQLKNILLNNLKGRN